MTREKRAIAHRREHFHLLRDGRPGPEVATLCIEGDELCSGPRVEWKGVDECLCGTRIQPIGWNVVCDHGRRVARHELVRPEGFTLEQQPARQPDVRIQRPVEGCFES